MTLQVHMIPEGQFQNKDLERLLQELQVIIKGKEVMNAADAAEFMGIGKTTIYKSSVPYHKLPGIEGRFYLRSEIIQYIKMQK